MVGAAFAVALAQTQNTIVESARQIPLAGEADVVVVGGTTAGVAAALAAKEAGASVWLLAERPYLGDDMAGTLQLALPNDAEPQGPLAEALWTDRSAALKIISYTANAETFSPHKETNPPSVLTDGLATDPVKESVQYNDERVKSRRSLPRSSSWRRRRPLHSCGRTISTWLECTSPSVRTARHGPGRFR